MQARLRHPLHRNFQLNFGLTLGSNVIVAGTAIFNAAEPEKVIAQLKATVDAAQAKLKA